MSENRSGFYHRVWHAPEGWFFEYRMLDGDLTQDGPFATEYEAKNHLWEEFEELLIEAEGEL